MLDQLIVLTHLSLVQSQYQTLLHQSERIEELESQLAWFKRQIFGRKSERFVAPDQTDLFAEQPVDEAPLPEDEIEPITFTRRKPKRNSLPRTVPAGTLDEHPSLEPFQNIFYASKAEWYRQSSELPKHDELPFK